MESPFIKGTILILLLVIASSQTSEVSIQTKKSIHRVDDRFISITIDPDVIIRGDLDSPAMARILAMARSLSPAYLRLAGPRTSKYHLIESDCFAINDNSTLTESQMESVGRFARKAGLRLLLAMNPSPRREDGTWNETQARRLLEIMDNMGLDIAVQMGFDRLHLEPSASGSSLGHDLASLARLLRQFPRYHDALLVGPDIVNVGSKRETVRLTDIFTVAEGSLSAVSWHPFPVIIRNTNDPDKIMDRAAGARDVLALTKKELDDTLKNILVKRKPLWIGESNAKLVEGRFVDALMWTSRLGQAAKMGVSVVMHSPTAHSINNPSTEFWVSALYKKLVGGRVLDTKLQPGIDNGRVHVFAHCSRDGASNGGVTVYAVNYGTKAVSTALKARWAAPSEHGVRKYILSTENGPLSRTMTLNGRPLTMLPNGEMPMFEPDIVATYPGATHVHIYIPAASIGFWEIPGAYAKACMANYKHYNRHHITKKQHSKRTRRETYERSPYVQEQYMSKPSMEPTPNSYSVNREENIAPTNIADTRDIHFGGTVYAQISDDDFSKPNDNMRIENIRGQGTYNPRANFEHEDLGPTEVKPQRNIHYEEVENMQSENGSPADLYFGFGEVRSEQYAGVPSRLPDIQSDLFEAEYQAMGNKYGALDDVEPLKISNNKNTGNETPQMSSDIYNATDFNEEEYKKPNALIGQNSEQGPYMAKRENKESETQTESGYSNYNEERKNNSESKSFKNEKFEKEEVAYPEYTIAEYSPDHSISLEEDLEPTTQKSPRISEKKYKNVTTSANADSQQNKEEKNEKGSDINRDAPIQQTENPIKEVTYAQRPSSTNKENILMPGDETKPEQPNFSYQPILYIYKNKELQMQRQRRENEEALKKMKPTNIQRDMEIRNEHKISNEGVKEEISSTMRSKMVGKDKGLSKYRETVIAKRETNAYTKKEDTEKMDATEATNNQQSIAPFASRLASRKALFKSLKQSNIADKTTESPNNSENTFTTLSYSSLKPGLKSRFNFGTTDSTITLSQTTSKPQISSNKLQTLSPVTLPSLKELKNKRDERIKKIKNKLSDRNDKMKEDMRLKRQIDHSSLEMTTLEPTTMFTALPLLKELKEKRDERIKKIKDKLSDLTDKKNENVRRKRQADDVKFQLPTLAPSTLFTSLPSLKELKEKRDERIKKIQDKLSDVFDKKKEDVRRKRQVGDVNFQLPTLAPFTSLPSLKELKEKRDERIKKIQEKFSDVFDKKKENVRRKRQVGDVNFELPTLAPFTSLPSLTELKEKRDERIKKIQDKLSDVFDKKKENVRRKRQVEYSEVLPNYEENNKKKSGYPKREDELILDDFHMTNTGENTKKYQSLGNAKDSWTGQVNARREEKVIDAYEIPATTLYRQRPTSEDSLMVKFDMKTSPSRMQHYSSNPVNHEYETFSMYDQDAWPSKTEDTQKLLRNQDTMDVEMSLAGMRRPSQAESQPRTGPKPGDPVDDIVGMEDDWNNDEQPHSRKRVPVYHSDMVHDEEIYQGGSDFQDVMVNHSPRQYRSNEERYDHNQEQKILFSPGYDEQYHNIDRLLTRHKRSLDNNIIPLSKNFLNYRFKEWDREQKENYNNLNRIDQGSYINDDKKINELKKNEIHEENVTLLKKKIQPITKTSKFNSEDTCPQKEEERVTTVASVNDQSTVHTPLILRLGGIIHRLVVTPVIRGTGQVVHGIRTLFLPQFTYYHERK